MTVPDAEWVGRTFQQEAGRSLAALVAAFGDVDLAEDAMQEAFARALDRWPEVGLPGGADSVLVAPGRPNQEPDDTGFDGPRPPL